MNIEKLEYLVEVAKTSSISAAAQNLHITISAISQAISSLEAEWGVIIFKRSRSGVLLTAEGIIILKKVYELLDKYEELKETAHGFSNPIMGNLRIATIPGPTSLIENAAIDFKKDYPQIRMEITEKGSQEIIDDILHQRIDLGFVILFENRPIEQIGLSIERLLTVKMVAAVSKQSPLASRKTITPEDLLEQTIVLYNDDYVKWYIDDFQVNFGPVDILFTTNNRNSIIRALRDHFAITIGLNYSFVSEMSSIREDSVILDLDLTGQSPVYLGLIQQKGKNSTLLSKNFKNRLKNDLSQFSELF
ncbi:LysR family transcriptional regulator [Paenibacillus sp. CGMCC 1.16610]|uniref:LysR family transcriptional regulator n=1 Tax=Paenibacillus anseongense TaxID=2682845 RepID=A0ABW9U000_9BACL|nr:MULTISPECIES: LysR family transcriptional regulator [Paenibacillus]MBA2937100.1 LysR family transcriptional regulator [Paenibacillus sp. CGMCC 1.16610]MVQ33422.1 LysR family transcriptional regulator [Paenibacillus anseongense]